MLALAATLMMPGQLAAHPSIDEQLSELDQLDAPGHCNAAAELKRGDLYRSRRAPHILRRQARNALRCQRFVKDGEITETNAE